MDKKYLVIGASGQVGRLLVEILKKKGQVVGTGHTRAEGLVSLDLADGPAVKKMIADVRPEAVFIPGGITNVDWCEDHKSEALAVNAQGPAKVASAAARVDAFTVYFSTDYVFDGEAGPYDESAPTHPLGFYAASKLEGELQVRNETRRSCVVRTSGVFSFDPTSKNFFMQVWERFKKGERVRAFVDQFLTQTYAPTLAEAAVEIAEKRLEGLIHVAGTDFANRVEFCEKVSGAFGFDAKLIDAVTSDKVSQKAKRPLKGGLKVDLARKLLKARLMGLDEALAEIRKRMGRAGV